MSAQSERDPALVNEHAEAPLVLPKAAQLPRRTVVKVVVAIVAIFVVAFIAGIVPKLRQRGALADEAARRGQQRLRVQVAHPVAAPQARTTTLPGTVSALKEAVIYARTSGYLKERDVDIGDRVKEGQLLAIIETPEVDEQIGQAKATLDQSKAAREQARTNLEFARISLERIRPLTPAGVASRQDLDQREAAYRAEQANLRATEAAIAANEANVRRLTELKNFSRVVAPFAGTIVERSVDVGALITSGNGSGQALFKLSASDPVRVFISVPQSLSPAIHAGGAAELQVRDFPGRRFIGHVTRDAQAIDVRSRTLLTEVQIPNHDGALLPGMYAQVTFDTPSARPSLLLDSSTLVATGQGSRVAVVADNGTLHLQPVTIDIDYGAQIAISEGIRPTDRVVLNANGELREGLAVEAVDAPSRDAAAAPPAKR